MKSSPRKAWVCNVEQNDRYLHLYGRHRRKGAGFARIISN